MTTNMGSATAAMPGVSLAVTHRHGVEARHARVASGHRGIHPYSVNRIAAQAGHL